MFLLICGIQAVPERTGALYIRGQTEVIVYIVCRLFPNGRVLYILQAVPERTGAVFPTADHHGELHDEPGGLSHGQAALPSPHWQL